MAAATQALPPNAEQIWAELEEGNRRFVTNRPQPRDLVHERAAVSVRQYPKAIVLACADSRVAPEIIFDQKLGDLFVVRGAGNTADAMDLGSIEFAVEELRVSLLMVMGHTHCGGIAVASAGGKFESANLKAIVRKLRPACELAKGVGEQYLRNAERINIGLAARDALDRSPMLHNFVQRGRLTVVQAYYDLVSGQVTRLN
jgi:carbonic anhydrase